ncbi:ribbon-helix-helix domain-containing protein [Salmonella enterica]|nr:ribbon-helix-helix domain-containing protein [Salmonella enterica]EAO0118497.1 ribbon-helix-helix domain-containing protein [Salmonella enterica]EAO3601717.1 ribbon-helix-helix domain-containing protein [Salmonella enterica]EAR6391614.1 ribbon-helix-helix domain-containing protein [Salmonella enterica]EAV1285259.1 ribbon-helix-helix domain-containing protein [Salmonella enterica]
MPSQVRAGVSVNATNDWVALTVKLPNEIKKKLKVVSAETGVKQQEILAEAVAQWMARNGHNA